MGNNNKKNENLDRLRESLVVRSNKMIQQGKIGLTLIEQRAIEFLIAKIRPGDTVNTEYTFTCRDFAQWLNWKNDSNNYTNIKAILQGLRDKSWWMMIDDSTEGLLSWFNIVHMKPNTGEITISFHPDMAPFLFDLVLSGEYYTSYQLDSVSQLKKKYSFDLYRLLKSYSNNSEWIFEYNTGSPRDIINHLSVFPYVKGQKTPIAKIPKNWEKWTFFDRSVLRPCVEEINIYTDLTVTYEGLKMLQGMRTKATRSIRFTIKSKTKTEKSETKSRIDRKYAENGNYQLSLEDFGVDIYEEDCGNHSEQDMPKNEDFSTQNDAPKDDIPLDEVYHALLNAKNLKVTCENTASQSENPYTDSMFDFLVDEGFSKSQIDYLIENAKLVACELDNKLVYKKNVESEQWDLFCCDLISYYLDYIKESDIKTEHSLYARLKTCVRNDYHKKARDYMNWFKG